MSLDPFHLSCWSNDLQRARRFYEQIGCQVLRERDEWIDFDFFGHQLTIHQARQPQQPVDGLGPSRRALDHFGLVLDKPHWLALLARLQGQDVSFRVAPGQDGERGKFVVVDPDGVGLEFKYDASKA